MRLASETSLRENHLTASHHDDLLTPTLTSEAEFQPIYSLRTGILSSFFGGPIASAVVTGVNAHRLKRVPKDAWLVVLGVVLGILLLWWQTQLGGNTWLQSMMGRTGPRLATRVVGLAHFGCTYLVHRQYYRNMDFAGIDPPNGWKVGLSAVLIAAVVTLGLALWLVA
jgi:hypothetical protein